MNGEFDLSAQFKESELAELAGRRDVALEMSRSDDPRRAGVGRKAIELIDADIRLLKEDPVAYFDKTAKEIAEGLE